MAELYRAQGRYSEAEPLHRRALEIAENAPGPEHPAVAVGLNNLALLYRAQGNMRKPSRCIGASSRSETRSWARSTPGWRRA